MRKLLLLITIFFSVLSVHAQDYGVADSTVALVTNMIGNFKKAEQRIPKQQFVDSIIRKHYLETGTVWRQSDFGYNYIQASQVSVDTVEVSYTSYWGTCTKLKLNISYATLSEGRKNIVVQLPPQPQRIKLPDLDYRELVEVTVISEAPVNYCFGNIVYIKMIFGLPVDSAGVATGVTMAAILTTYPNPSKGVFSLRVPDTKLCVYEITLLHLGTGNTETKVVQATSKQNVSFHTWLTGAFAIKIFNRTTGKRETIRHVVMR